MSAPAAPALSPRERRRSIAIVILSTSVVAVTLGLTWPLLSLMLEAQGVSRTLIGLSSASQLLAIVVVMPLTPWLLARLGTRRLMAWLIAGTVVTLLLLPAFPNVYAWFPIRFVLGAGLELLFIAGDIWINQAVEERSRGRVIGLYGFVLAGSFAAGPAIISLTGNAGWTPFVIGAVVVGLGAIPLAFARGIVPPVEGKPSGGPMHFLRLAPTLMLAGLMYGLIDSAVLSFLPLYGLSHGLAEATAVSLLTVLIVGMVLGQLPIGYLADKLDPRTMIVACTVVTLGAALLLPLAIGRPALQWPLLVVWGAALGGFYTLGMIMMGQRFRGADLAAVNAAFVVLWGVGGIGGPAITGTAMDLFGPDALPAFVAAACLVFLPVAALRYLRHRRRQASGATDLRQEESHGRD
ncbi:MAG: MFS transporter [Alphaproteobacteria bacterium]